MELLAWEWFVLLEFALEELFGQHFFGMKNLKWKELLDLKRAAGQSMMMVGLLEQEVFCLELFGLLMDFLSFQFRSCFGMQKEANSHFD